MRLEQKQDKESHLCLAGVWWSVRQFSTKETVSTNFHYSTPAILVRSNHVEDHHQKDHHVEHNHIACTNEPFKLVTVLSTPSSRHSPCMRPLTMTMHYHTIMASIQARFAQIHGNHGWPVSGGFSSIRALRMASMVIFFTSSFLSLGLSFSPFLPVPYGELPLL